MDIQDMVREQIAREQAIKEQQIRRLLRNARMEYEDLEKHGYRIVMEIRPIGGVKQSRVSLAKIVATDIVHFEPDPLFRII